MTTFTIAFLLSFFYFSTGNKKLKATADTKFLIWSLPAVITCPYRTGHCEADCYALKAEKVYPGCLPSRMRNYEFSKSDLFVPYVSAFIRLKASNKRWKAAKRIIVRIHESGDFYNQEYFDKWLQIANNCKDIENVVFMAYTKSLPFVHDIPANMIVRSSIWDDTKPEMIELTEALNLPIYTAVKEFTTETKSERCLCKSCGECNKCWSKLAMLKCEIH